MSSMLRILYTLPRTIVLLLQPQDFSEYVNVPDRGFICDIILTNRFVCREVVECCNRIFHQLSLPV